jgi:hypothetical protein
MGDDPPGRPTQVSPAARVGPHGKSAAPDVQLAHQVQPAGSPLRCHACRCRLFRPAPSPIRPSWPRSRRACPRAATCPNCWAACWTRWSAWPACPRRGGAPAGSIRQPVPPRQPDRAAARNCAGRAAAPTTTAASAARRPRAPSRLGPGTEPLPGQCRRRLDTPACWPCRCSTAARCWASTTSSTARHVNPAPTCWPAQDPWANCWAWRCTTRGWKARTCVPRCCTNAS